MISANLTNSDTLQHKMRLNVVNLILSLKNISESWLQKKHGFVGTYRKINHWHVMHTLYDVKSTVYNC